MGHAGDGRRPQQQKGQLMKFDRFKPYLYGMLAGFGAIALSILFFFAVYRYKGFGEALDGLLVILSPFIYGGVIAYLLKPVCNTYERLLLRCLPRNLKRWADPLAITLSMITGVLIVYVLIMMILPELWRNIISLVALLPARTEAFIDWLTLTFADNKTVMQFINESYATLQATLNDWLKNTLMPWLQDLLGGVGVGVMSAITTAKNLIIGLFAAVYLLASRKKFGRQAKMLLYSSMKSSWADIVMEEICYADRMFGGFINGKILDSAIIGVICYVCCLLFRFPNPLLISAIIGVTNVIPFFGPFLGAIPAAILILLQNPIQSIWFLLFIFVLQQLDGNYIGPKILGNITGLNSFWVLFSILLFGGLWSFTGMIIAVPLFAVIYDVARKLIFRGLRRHGREDLLAEYHSAYETADERAAEVALQVAAEEAAKAEADRPAE